MENIADKVGYVLKEYCSNKGCPCNIKQFVYWAGKQQGPGWQDNIQNQLVKSSLELVCFEQIDDCEKSYGLEGSYICNNCGVKWNYFQVTESDKRTHCHRIGYSDTSKYCFPIVFMTCCTYRTYEITVYEFDYFVNLDESTEVIYP